MTIKNKWQPPRIPPLGSLLLILAGVSFVAYLFWPRSQSLSDIPITPYSTFLEQVDEGEVKQVKIADNIILYKLKPPIASLPDDLIPNNPLQSSQKGNNPFYSSPNASEETSESQPGQIFATIPLNDPQLPQLLREKGVSFEAAPPPQNGWLMTLLAWVVPPLILVAAMQYFVNRNDDTRQSLLFNKNKAKVYVEGETEKITFANVAGAEEAKTELVEIVEFLKDPGRFSRIGARIPKGVLLVGPPGTGKTLLAKAVAGEAGVTFFSISASEFIELFVGTGAARVRDLFKQAKEQAPCIIFIDELDAIGKSRASGGAMSGGSDEREQTLNQLLTEMDGFSVGEATVIVLAATNRPETLDSALLRPGRFDRQVLVDRPDLAGRMAILEVYARKIPLADDVDLKALATQTPGFAGADLANLVNEAALLAARKQQEKVSQADFKEAIERVVAGLEKKSRVLNEQEKRIVAYHEVGHALVGAVMPGGGKVEKISIVPRGMSALGYTLKLPTEDRFLMTDAEFRQQIAMLLGGRAAEAIVFGSVTNGASDDLRRATDIAERMVTTYGMSKILGPLAYDKGASANFLSNGNGSIRRPVSDETAKAIDEEVKQIVEGGYQQALAILTQNRELLERISQQLLQTEVIEGEQLHGLLNQASFVDDSWLDSNSHLSKV
ncbi:ATP-dependent metalloprotease FtsH [Gloeothece citriformis PCC 7424]|uniref:ATP-dependent zinc metalloprotease FtsH n=1 Tax=Gloeothece citriformis (strain PCC 7424) TaxID=65393 RepID=B7K6U5_GLOC7|nr:ATP-dependent zinc metalloprotease FtsH [Gloeothece citriformis]ACK72644.1 ATP-dependent metalloprotease FtsH [Gloeothece citriformis PCC 7424]